MVTSGADQVSLEDLVSNSCNRSATGLGTSNAAWS
jgi:hypothetical protein